MPASAPSDPKHYPDLSGPAMDAFEITPADGSNLPTKVRGIYVGVAGDVKVDTIEGTTVTFKNALAGIVLPIRAQRVYSTGTSATDLVGLF